MTHLQKITTLAKKIRKGKPSMKWTDAIKQASKQIKPAAKKAAPKKVGAVKKAGPKKTAKKPVKKTLKYQGVIKSKTGNTYAYKLGGAGNDIKTYPLKVYAEHLRRIKYFNVQIVRCKLLLKCVTNSFAKAQISNDLKVYQKQLLLTKKMAAIQKRLI